MNRFYLHSRKQTNRHNSRFFFGCEIFVYCFIFLQFLYTNEVRNIQSVTKLSVDSVTSAINLAMLELAAQFKISFKELAAMTKNSLTLG